jgi:hypothetical protein
MILFYNNLHLKNKPGQMLDKIENSPQRLSPIGTELGRLTRKT